MPVPQKFHVARAKIRPIMPHQKTAAQVVQISLSCLIILASATALALAWPHARTAALGAARDHAAQLIAEAAAARPPEAAVNYKLATWLDPSNEAGYLGIARAQIAAGRAEAALTALDRAGEGSEAAELRIRTLIELGRTNEAADRATTLATPGRSDNDVVLAALSYALAGRTQDIAPLKPLVSSPQAAERISRIAVGELPLAGELYFSGLPESSEKLLLKLPTSFARNVLLARIHHERHTAANLETATNYLTTAITLNPAEPEARQLLAAVYAERGLTAESEAQTTQAKKLRAGQP